MGAQVKRLVVLIVLFGFVAGCGLPSHGFLGKGSRAPSVVTRTLSDVGGDFSKITTYRYPDKRMYQFSVDEALASGKPIVLEFATPGHCTVCDKQLQMLKALLAKYHDDVIFLHMDQYQNPQAFKAFAVTGDPWTFVIDRDSTVLFSRAGRLLYNELEPVIVRVLAQHTAFKE